MLRVTALLHVFILVKISRGWTINLFQSKESGIELWNSVTWGMRRMVLQQFSPVEVRMTERADDN